ncbi:protein-L-isoaspartate O-methyltransferase-domain-containing protein [Xylariaceae sp. FL0255]|nr:protein-L-isoaspartate O-methyltransferase-domain-containing protein [Xylariaceae sp. FL0255]
MIRRTSWTIIKYSRGLINSHSTHYHFISDYHPCLGAYIHCASATHATVRTPDIVVANHKFAIPYQRPDLCIHKRHLGIRVCNQQLATMAWRSSGKCNSSLITNLWNNGLITQPAVKEAFLRVDRGDYAPARPYEDSPQQIGHAATISAPHMHASAIESLLPFLLPNTVTGRPRRVLDIGSGSGYLTHILAELAGEQAVVVGLEHIKELKELGESNMAKSESGRNLLRSGRVRFRFGDGRKGWVEPEDLDSNVKVSADGQNVGGPADESDAQGWDAIHVGAAAKELHEDLVNQLRRPGRMFIPVDDSVNKWEQHIWVVDKDKDGNIERKKMYGVRYVPLTDAPVG